MSEFRNFITDGEYDNMNFLKLHLQPNQVLQLFFWIEESVYRFQPQKYFAFLLKVLEKEENLIWLPKETGTGILEKTNGAWDRRSWK